LCASKILIPTRKNVNISVTLAKNFEDAISFSIPARYVRAGQIAPAAGIFIGIVRLNIFLENVEKIRF